MRTTVVTTCLRSSPNGVQLSNRSFCLRNNSTRPATSVNSKVSVGTSTLFIILAFMLASPRFATKTAIEAEIAGYDDTVTNRALMMATWCLASL